MKRFWMLRMMLLTLLVALVLTALTAVAMAQEGPLPEVDPGAAGAGLMAAFKAGAIILGVIFGGMLVVYFLTLFLIPNLQGKAKAITAVILIGIAGVCSHKIAGSDWVSAIVAGLMEGFVAGKAWDLVPDKITDAMKAPVKAKRKP